MTPWQEPTEQTALSLPIENNSSLIQVKVDSNFLSIWHNGPTDNSISALQTATYILTRPLMKLVKHAQGQVDFCTKDHAHDLVTTADKGIEVLLRKWIKKHFPTHKIVGEEGSKDSITSTDYVWYLDPIDGTHNFVHKQREVAMHIACIHNGAPVVGIVACPFQDIIYHLKGETTFKNDAPVTMKPNPSLIIGTEFLDTYTHENTQYTQALAQFQAKPYRIKSIGYHVTQFFEQDLDVFYKPACKLWDVMAPFALLWPFRDHYHLELTYAGNADPLSPKNGQTVSLFTNSEAIVAHFNKRHKTTARMGFVCAYKKEYTHIRDYIFNHFYPVKHNERYT